FRDPAGQPVVTRGYSQIIPAYRTPISGLYLANTTQIYPEDRGMNYSVRLGQTIARVVQDGG
ncbi:MAG: amine oxidase, partial [Chloroflexota bacterium]|nr:amine oxidase [Chloroflexota bacterium]